jgi:hypothetical protein
MYIVHVFHVYTSGFTCIYRSGLIHDSVNNVCAQLDFKCVYLSFYTAYTTTFTCIYRTYILQWIYMLLAHFLRCMYLFLINLYLQLDLHVFLTRISPT